MTNTAKEKPPAAPQSYKGWPLLEVMPEGWSTDKTAGSPLHGYVFINNRESVLRGQKRALLRVYRPNQVQTALPAPVVATPASAPVAPAQNKPATQVIDASSAKAFNDLARKTFQHKLLADIKVDLMICEIEGWDKLEYIRQIQSLVCGIGRSPPKAVRRCVKPAFTPPLF